MQLIAIVSYTLWYCLHCSLLSSGRVLKSVGKGVGGLFKNFLKWLLTLTVDRFLPSKGISLKVSKLRVDSKRRGSYAKAIASSCWVHSSW